MYGFRGFGDVTYDAAGMPIEDPANTTYGATSGGSYPAALAYPGGAFCLTPGFPWIGKTVAGAPGVCAGTPTIPDPWGNILTVVVPAAVLFAMFKRGR